MMHDPFAPFAPSEFRVKFAASRWEREAAYALRRAVFCDEQRIFVGDDRDTVDDYAIPIVALSMLGVAADRVVGAVRIHEEAPGVWWGSRLAVDAEFRRVGAIGATLIRLAVSSAHAMGAHTFLAHVQAQNGLLFQSLHWETLAEVELHGHPHLKMRANLSKYPPCPAPEVGFVALRESGVIDAGAFEVLVTALRANPGLAGKADIAAVAARLGLASAKIPVGDDCAAIPDGDGHLLLAMEGFIAAFVEADPWFAGWCGVMVNLSDIAAMGGRALAICDALWANGEAGAAPLLEGLAAAAAAYGVPIVGGHSNLKSKDALLSVAVLGRAGKSLLTSFDARPGDALLLVADHRGEYRGPFNNYQAALKAPPERLRADLALWPQLAEAGLCRAAKDVSQAGIVGTAAMLAETSGVAIDVDLEAIRPPPGVTLERWLKTFPSYGFLLSVAPRHVEATLALFHARDLHAAVIGDVGDGVGVTLRAGAQRAPLRKGPLMGFAPARSA